jgi:hypothetical protein
MKGTSRRGLTFQEDERFRSALGCSVKDRAENAMVVDMVRNDIGRIARWGSVRVDSAFDLEKYPTLFQMTSTVTGETSASFVAIVRALFPAASITGAPKIRSMQIIRELEPDARGVYTGCVGYLAPRRRARFSVAIRTVAIDRAARRAETATTPCSETRRATSRRPRLPTLSWRNAGGWLRRRSPAASCPACSGSTSWRPAKSSKTWSQSKTSGARRECLPSIQSAAGCPRCSNRS